MNLSENGMKKIEDALVQAWGALHLHAADDEKEFGKVMGTTQVALDAVSAALEEICP